MNLPKFNPNTPTLMDGEVRLFKRKRSSVWQVVFTMDGRQVRVLHKVALDGPAAPHLTVLRIELL